MNMNHQVTLSGTLLALALLATAYVIACLLMAVFDWIEHRGRFKLKNVQGCACACLAMAGVMLTRYSLGLLGCNLSDTGLALVFVAELIAIPVFWTWVSLNRKKRLNR
jgi:hypothetical protein